MLSRNVSLLGIFDRSDFLAALRNGSMNLPSPASLPNSDIESTFFFLGDGAFPLSTNLMKPFGGSNLSMDQRVFNYR